MTTIQQAAGTDVLKMAVLVKMVKEFMENHQYSPIPSDQEIADMTFDDIYNLFLPKTGK